MGKIYTILIYLMIIPILVCIKNIKKFHNDISSSITRCLVFAIFTILGNGLFTLNINETISYLAMALYLFAYDLMLIYILQYSQQYKHSVFVSISILHNIFSLFPSLLNNFLNISSSTFTTMLFPACLYNCVFDVGIDCAL